MSNKILDDMRDVMRRRHYSIRTERSYCGWVKRFRGIAGRYGPRLNKSKDRLTGLARLNKCNNGI